MKVKIAILPQAMLFPAIQSSCSTEMTLVTSTGEGIPTLRFGTFSGKNLAIDHTSGLVIILWPVLYEIWDAYITPIVRCVLAKDSGNR